MIHYEVDLLTPTTIRGDDGWRTVMENEQAPKRFSEFQLSKFLNQLEAGNRRQQYRVREVNRVTNIRKL